MPKLLRGILQSRVYLLAWSGTAIFLANQGTELGGKHRAFIILRARLYPRMMQVVPGFAYFPKYFTMFHVSKGAALGPIIVVLDLIARNGVLAVIDIDLQSTHYSSNPEWCIADRGVARLPALRTLYQELRRVGWFEREVLLAATDWRLDPGTQWYVRRGCSEYA